MMRPSSSRLHEDMIDNMILLDHSKRLPLIVHWGYLDQLCP